VRHILRRWNWSWRYRQVMTGEHLAGLVIVAINACLGIRMQ
jgi:hypothetical protein